MELDVSESVPLLTLRKLAPKQILNELLWYLRGEDNVRSLRKVGNKFWDADADEDGWVGYNYGLLTHWPLPQGGSLNQLQDVVRKLRTGGASRTLCITLLKPGEPTKLVWDWLSPRTCRLPPAPLLTLDQIDGKTHP